MPDLRQNLATKEWIIIAGERAKRPEDLASQSPAPAALPAVDPGCPFCRGHEAQTPPALLTLPQDAPADDWEVRVIPNKFPALVPGHDETCRARTAREGLYLHREGIGRHEVIIETPWHNRDIPFQSPWHIELITTAYCQRYQALIRYQATELVVIFRNHGKNAGTSLLHPHSQVVASSVVPFHVRNKIYEGERYFDENNRCVYCDMIAYELRDGSRVIMENANFVAIAPYASGVPYEMWILPKAHQATFGAVDRDQVRDLGMVLQDMLVRLWRLLDDPDYNYIIDTVPEHLAGVPFYHWHLEIYPKVTMPAGFEIGSGIGINIVAPEVAAAQLREVNGTPLHEP